MTEDLWVLAAVAALSRTDGAIDPAVEDILVASGLAERQPAGGIVVAAGLANLRSRAVGESIVSAMARATDAAKGRNAAAWNPDDDTLRAQGRASARVGRLLATTVASQLPGLAKRLAQPGAAVLDVGTGVAELACAMAEVLPSVRVDGIDILDRALRLAKQEIAHRELVERVRVRHQSVTEIDESDAYDLVWLPLPFIPPEVANEAFPALLAALRPGGWLVAGLGRTDGSPLAVAVTRWQAKLASGTALTPQQATQLLAAHGFADVVNVDTPPGAPVLVAGCRQS